MGAFDAEQFVADCILASQLSEPIAALQEIVSRAISQPAELNARFPVPLDPDDTGILHRSESLTVTSAIFPRGFSTGIHNHNMPAIIGVWSGSEENIFYDHGSVGVVPSKAVRVEAGHVLELSTNAIHDVHIPKNSWSGALHVYLGDLIGVTRSEWNNASAEAVPFDGKRMQQHWLDAAIDTGLVAQR